MTSQHTPLTASPEWQELMACRERLQNRPMRALFAADPERATRYFIDGAGLSLDFSRNRLTDDVFEALVALARRCRLEDRRAALLRGEKVNVTEDRPALHTALRNPGTDTIIIDGQDVIAEVNATLARMDTFVQEVLDQSRTGYTGKAFTDVVSIGIGGSFWAPNWCLRHFSHTNHRAFVATTWPTLTAQKSAKPWRK